VSTFPPVPEQLDLLLKGVEACEKRGELEKKLVRSAKTGKPLLVKVGFDPSAPDLHLGHTVVFRKMRHFQRLGHTVVFLIGDFTGMIGDPTGKKVTRPQLTKDEVLANAETYKVQVFKILDPAKTRVAFNSEWLSALGAEGLVRLSAKYTVARLLERDDFAKRFREGKPIAVHELLYPLCQGYDSVALEADVELGGTDQLYNLLAGREVMPHYGLEPQVVLTTPLLLSWDGAKMSSSVGNNIPLTAAPEEMFGRTMRISDDQLAQWYELVLEQPAPAGDPLEAKLALARFIVARSHGEEAAKAAEEHFARVVRRGEAPEDVPELALDGDDPVHLPKLIADAGLAASTSEARRLIGQGAVKLNGEAVSELDLPRETLANGLLQVGKRRFARLTP
jgi:tyrosyl-tRNA synthetase